MSTETRITKNIKTHIVYLTIIVVLITTIITMVSINKQEKEIKPIDKEPTKQIVSEKNEVKTQKRIDKKENIVIFGDSITEIYPVEEIYGDIPIINSGISGFKTTDLLERMDTMLYKYNPTKVFLLIGTNDVLFDPSEETQNSAVDNIKEIVKEIKKNRSKAKIYVESIYPVNKSMDEKFNFKSNNDIINSMNSKIKEFCEDENITYINMHDELTNSDGDFDRNYTYDGLHPNDLGYAKITRVLMPYIYE